MRDWRGGDTGWTTYFPKKVSELGAGWDSAAVVSKVADRLDVPVLQHELHDESIAATSTIPSVTVGSSLPKNGSVGIPETLDGPRFPAEPVERLGLQTAQEIALRGGAYSRAEAFVSGHRDQTVDEHTDLDPVDDQSMSAGHVGLRQHFTLPTESWANRSSGQRGLYFNHGAGASREASASRDRWPRKRSSGTTMRVDDDRPDLRLFSEYPRPSTAPARITEAMKHGMQATQSIPMDAICCRLSSSTNR